MSIVLTSKATKLLKLCERSGFADLSYFLADCAKRESVPAICMTEGCDYVGTIGRAEAEGRCPRCGGETVTSALVLATAPKRRSA